MKRVATVWLCVCFASCLSVGTPPPPVRWFDPVPQDVVVADDAPLLGGVLGAVHLRQELALRVGPRELRYDGDRLWLREPADCVRLSLERAGWICDAGRDAPVLEVQAFELDVQQAVARVVVALRVDGEPARIVRVAHEADGATDEALVAAMSEVLAALPAQVRDALARGK